MQLQASVPRLLKKLDLEFRRKLIWQPFDICVQEGPTPPSPGVACYSETNPSWPGITNGSFALSPGDDEFESTTPTMMTNLNGAFGGLSGSTSSQCFNQSSAI